MHDVKEFWLLAGKYLEGGISGSETAVLFEMMEKDSSLRDEFEATKKLWKDSAAEEQGYDRGVFLRTIRKINDYEEGRLASPELPPYEGSVTETAHEPLFRRRRIGAWKKWIAAAAALTGVFLISYWLLNGSGRAHKPVQWATIDVQPGRHERLVLPDSTVVIVNAGSHIEYPLSFTDSIREIHLDGEAFFEVTNNPEQPFIVTSGVLRTKVLGTSFNVRCYKEDETQTVLVATGKVQVNAAGHPPIQVLPDQLLTYRIKAGNSIITGQPHEEMNWQRNRMAFNDISFRDLAGELGRRYAKKLVFADPPLQHCRYRVSFNDLPLEKILQQLSLTNGFSYMFKGDSIYLKGKGCM